jgi:hypothetical protein
MTLARAWSQNLGHEGVLTTFYSSGAVGNRLGLELCSYVAYIRP